MPRRIIHISGPDRAGITTRLLQSFVDQKIRVLDIGQSVLGGFLTLSALTDCPASISPALLKTRIKKALGSKTLEVSIESATVKRRQPEHLDHRVRVTVLGQLEDSKAISKITKTLADQNYSLGAIETLTHSGLQGLALLATSPKAQDPKSTDHRVLRSKLFEIATEQGIDLAVQRDSVWRRFPRLLVMDVDSTFISVEVIDELARLAGRYTEVAAITDRAMRGEIDFSDALRMRVKCLKGLKLSQVQSLKNSIVLNPGAASLIEMLRKLGFKIGLVSGGFDVIVDWLKAQWSLDFAFSNSLGVAGDALNGELSGPLIDADRKAQVLGDMTQAYGFHIEQSIAIGDGANDKKMLELAGLGVAYRGKDALKKVAHGTLANADLKQVLYLLGLPEWQTQ